MKVYSLKNKEDFDNVIKLSNNNLVLLDFTASWCGPCKNTAKILDNLPDIKNLYIVKIDVDQYEDISNKFGVRSLPTLVFVKSSKIKETLKGTPDKDKLVELINKYV